MSISSWATIWTTSPSRCTLTADNTRTVASAIVEGEAEIGFIEGEIDEPALAVTRLATDQIVIVVAADNPVKANAGQPEKQLLNELSWVMREEGSGTRSQFEAALRSLSFDPADLKIAFALPSNEAVLYALQGSRCAAALSRSAAALMIKSGMLRIVDIELPPRTFMSIRHKERAESAAARELRRICVDYAPTA